METAEERVPADQCEDTQNEDRHECEDRTEADADAQARTVCAAEVEAGEHCADESDDRHQHEDLNEALDVGHVGDFGVVEHGHAVAGDNIGQIPLGIGVVQVVDGVGRKVQAVRGVEAEFVDGEAGTVEVLELQEQSGGYRADSDCERDERNSEDDPRGCQNIEEREPAVQARLAEQFDRRLFGLSCTTGTPVAQVAPLFFRQRGGPAHTRLLPAHRRVRLKLCGVVEFGGPTGRLGAALTGAACGSVVLRVLSGFHPLGHEVVGGFWSVRFFSHRTMVPIVGGKRSDDTRNQRRLRAGDLRTEGLKAAQSWGRRGSL